MDAQPERIEMIDGAGLTRMVLARDRAEYEKRGYRLVGVYGETTRVKAGRQEPPPPPKTPRIQRG